MGRQSRAHKDMHELHQYLEREYKRKIKDVKLSTDEIRYTFTNNIVLYLEVDYFGSETKKGMSWTFYDHSKSFEYGEGVTQDFYNILEREIK